MGEERPDRMKRNGRQEDIVFEPAEKLYRRYQRVHFIGGLFSGMGLSFKNPPSVNREKYSEALDVVFSETDEWSKWGVLSFLVQQIPNALPAENPEYSFFPKHRPLENNYSHSEVHCSSWPANGAYVEPKPAIRKLFRATLSQKIIVEVQSQI